METMNIRIDISRVLDAVGKYTSYLGSRLGSGEDFERVAVEEEDEEFFEEILARGCMEIEGEIRKVFPSSVIEGSGKYRRGEMIVVEIPCGDAGRIRHIEERINEILVASCLREWCALTGLSLEEKWAQKLAGHRQSLRSLLLAACAGNLRIPLAPF